MVFMVISGWHGKRRHVVMFFRMAEQALLDVLSDCRGSMFGLSQDRRRYGQDEESGAGP